MVDILFILYYDYIHPFFTYKDDNKIVLIIIMLISNINLAIHFSLHCVQRRTIYNVIQNNIAVMRL